MSRVTPTFLGLTAAFLMGTFALHELTGFGSDAFDAAFAEWFQPIVFLACGLATLLRVATLREERVPWALLGTGLVLYAAGSIYYNLALGDLAAPPFPSLADGLWLALYPFSFAAITILVRHRFAHLPAGVWLDGVIVGTMVAALAAAVLLEPVFALTVENGAASAARLAYPLGDLICLGVIVVVWRLSGRRPSWFWALLGAGFALLAIGDSVYIDEAARGTWAPGGLLDLPYALATIALAAAAWAAPTLIADSGRRQSTTSLAPVGVAVIAVALTVFAVAGDLNPLAKVLTLVTLVGVLIRLGFALATLSRRSSDLAAQASTDPLTGLTNHRAFHERLAQELDRARRQNDPLTVVAVDIDFFKIVNDTYGHAEGDLALQAVARELSAHARAYDVVGRVGGEEFALILPGIDGAGGYAIAERCRLAVARLQVQGQALSCSAGVASYPADDADGHRLLELADGALYWAKRAGRAQVRRYDPSEVVLLSGSEQHQQVMDVLAGDDALTPFFQPIVELGTGRIAGYEALTRFFGTEPVRPPDQWFAQARRCGLGPQLEARAIAVALAHPGRPANTFLSVNMSPATLTSEEVARVLPEDLHDMVIELTEDDLFSSDPALDVALDRLRERGARIAVDDAGAGYAGLQQMVRIKPDILKLDRSLISGIHQDASKIALLEAMARFATTTGAAVCAEGIEEIDELRVLGRFDVTYGQGYALGRPGPDWPGVDRAVAASVTAEARWGMRVMTGTNAPSGEVTIGDISDVLCHVRSSADLDRAVDMIVRLLHADDVVVSMVVPGERCVRTLSSYGFGDGGQRYSFDDYPTTEHVVVHQTLGQVLEGDPAADPAELAILREGDYSAVLMAPIIFHGHTIGLLEVYRRTARPWAGTEVDQIRMLAHQLSGVLAGSKLGVLPDVVADVSERRSQQAAGALRSAQPHPVGRRVLGR